MSTATISIVSVDAATLRRAGGRTVLVLNASYQPLRPVNLKRAVTLLASAKAVIEKAEEGRFVRTSSGVDMFPWPLVIRLAKFVQVAYDKIHGPLPWTKRRVLERDGHRCGYCSSMQAHTVDHIKPRAQGGKSTWLNTVAACQSCNGRKRDRTPAQAGMKLLATPYVPRRP